MKIEELKVIKILNKRASHKAFLDKEISKEALDVIIDAARRAPTSRHAQAYSIICLREKHLLKAVSEIVGQPYIADANVMLVFVADFYRFTTQIKPGQVNGYENQLNPYIASTLDIGLALMASITQAEEMGIGTCCIGALRFQKENDNKLEKLSKLLDLPKNTAPTCGLIMGYKKSDVPTKVRLPKECQVFMNKYDHNAYEKVKDEYDKQIVEHYTNIGSLNQAKPWSSNINVGWIFDADKPSWTVNSNEMVWEFLNKQKILLKK